MNILKPPADYAASLLAVFATPQDPLKILIYATKNEPKLPTDYLADVYGELVAQTKRNRTLDDLREVRREISRLNEARGETVFNPAATQALDGLIEQIEGKEG
jgi:hypothetical protein